LRTFAVTSPSRGDGKSTIAFNLAKAMGNLEPRVLLVDADLRRPTLHDLAQCSNKYGLSDVLQSGRSLDSTVQAISPTVDLLAAGHCVDNPVGLVQSPAFDEMLREAGNTYAIVIVDTPALTCVSDAYLIVAKSDAAVLVISANETAERDTREVVSRFGALGIDNLVGVVLNRDRKRVTDYSDYFVQVSHDALPGRSG
jgi:capsular exopolysaccharide synthesis family protein